MISHLHQRAANLRRPTMTVLHVKSSGHVQGLAEHVLQQESGTHSTTPRL